jgi:Uncharacterized conserved protein
MEFDRRTALRAAGALLGGSAIPATASAARSRQTGSPSGGTSQEGYGPLGSVAVSGAREAVVADDLAYVAASNGFAVVDVADPAEPTVLAEHREIETDTDQSLRGIWDLWPSGDRLAVAGPAQFTPNQPSGVALFDVGDPTQPEQVAFHPTDDHIHNAYFTDETVYVTGRDRGMSVVMVDVSDDDPVEVGRWSPLDEDERWADVAPPLRALHDVYVQDGTAYLPYWDAGTWMVDVSDPGNPEALGRVADATREQLAAVSTEEAFLVARTPGGADHYATVNEDGTLLLVGRETWAVDDRAGRLAEGGGRVGGASGVDIYDVSDPEEPEKLSTIAPPASFDQTTEGWFTTSHNADFRGDRLYTSWYFGGVGVYDVSDPAAPTELARWRNPRETSFWTAQAADGCYVASSVDLSSGFGGLNETREALYTFPDRAGSQADPPSLTDWPEDVLGPEPDDRPGVDPGAGRVASVVDVPGADPPDGTDDTGDTGDTGDGTVGSDGDPDDRDTDSEGVGDGDTDDGGAGNGTTDESGDAESTDGTGAGLGVGAALAGLSGYLLARRADGLNDSRSE